MKSEWLGAIISIGCCVASFINVIVYRVPKNISIVTRRSFCPNCKKTIPFYQMIPIFSWLLLKGKCANCNHPIARKEFLVEILGGLIALLCFLKYGSSIEMVFVLGVGMLLLLIAAYDYETMIILDSFLLLVLAFSIISIWLYKDVTMLDRVIGMFCISLPMLILTWMLPNSFGGGDIKMMFGIGLLLGWQQTVLAMFIGVMVAGIYGLYFIAVKGGKQTSRIAFGPFICAGIMVALVYGNKIIEMYVSFYLQIP